MTDNLVPYMCFTFNLATKEIILVKRGHVGFWETKPDMTPEYADTLNERLGVTHAMREAMTVGSCFGWDVPGADHRKYADNCESLVDLVARKGK